VQATITNATGGNFENLVPSTVPAVTSVTDTIDTTTVKSPQHLGDRRPDRHLHRQPDHRRKPT
jgi:hypothetical protein